MNNRRKFIGTAVAIAAGTIVAKAIPKTTMESKYPVVHHVFFWLKNPESKEDKDKLIAGIKALKKIEHTIKFRVLY